MNDIISVELVNCDDGDIFDLIINEVQGGVVISSPFGNCQNFSIKYFYYLIDYCYDVSKMAEIIRKVKRVCDIDKPFLIVDLNESSYIKIKDYVKFHTVTPYTNANTSQMVLCIIDTRLEN